MLIEANEEQYEVLSSLLLSYAIASLLECIPTVASDGQDRNAGNNMGITYAPLVNLLYVTVTMGDFALLGFLALDQNLLSGTVRAESGKLTALTVLSICNNSLFG